MSDAPADWRHVPGPLASLRCGSGPRLVFVHGFTQTGRSWLPVAKYFVDDHEVVLVDAPGHGESSHVEADLGRGADLLAEIGSAGTYVGYSMGGRLCLHLALAHPTLVQALGLVGATAGIVNDRERSERRRADEALAVEIETTGVDAFLEKWLGRALFATLPDRAKGLQDRRQNTTRGLASSLLHAGTGTQSSLWPRLAEITAPTLVMAGEHDTKFTSIGHDLVAAIGANATFTAIREAGHAAHLEDPEAVATAVRSLRERATAI